MRFDLRKLAVATTGFCAFLNLYSPQALLPELAAEFGVGPAEISGIMTAGTAAIALTAPFTGAIADVLGRRRGVTPGVLGVGVPLGPSALPGRRRDPGDLGFVQGPAAAALFSVRAAHL